jgi:2-polyprenyl-3-methyl-5-hydroxy-6-metoxy-1,4-benzoquinol methylase
MLKKEKITFSFGKNWSEFIKGYYTPERLDEAVKSLKEITQLDSLQGKTFLDIGSGSGLFSLAAHRLSASRIESMDVDPFSVQTTKYVKEQYGDNTSTWSVQHGSILDTGWLKDHLHTADIVYSWGVLHHTGSMWEAITNAAAFVNPQGKFIIAIYNKREGFMGSKFWWQVKRLYNKAPSWVQAIMYGTYFICFFCWPIIKRPLKLRRRFLEGVSFIRNYKSSRGMNYWTNIKDWLGGFPYEYATVDEMVSFVEKLGFTTVQVWPDNGTGCSEFLFIKKI